ncbi:Hypothetical protein R9X50_00181600 [Acrodontium crateriforme]|uniref:Dihydrofolate synthetase n=1 Tax=Acrodontium crateriforme TaxID=150365 RepID=A0AAQ3M1E3_9PEZI|nr:Hypothetical protein R9X50_00181600 [Acrodontium crateriforme]
MIELGLQRISRLLATTPLPWRAVHVAGTNGKGSVCVYISDMLSIYNQSKWRQAQQQKIIKHARFTSPHLVDRWDCITVDQKSVPFEVFRPIEESVHVRNQRQNIQASEFELLTATAFEVFTREKIDVGVIEVGLGGRLDATNVLGQAVEDCSIARPSPLVTAITKIGLDHQGFLGNNLEEIAIQKAGIFKPGVPAVVDFSNDDVVLRALSKKAGDRLVAPFNATPIGNSHRGQTQAPEKMLPHVQSNVDVAFRSTWTALQRINCIPWSADSLPIESVDQLKHLASQMLAVPRQGTTFPGRLQLLSIEHLTGRKLPILLDGAHNQQSAQVLATAVNMLRSSPKSSTRQPVTWILAASDTKSITPILQEILKPGDRIFAVEFGAVDGMPWVKPMSAEIILNAARELIAHDSRSTFQSFGMDLASALRAASNEALEGPLVVAGSLYLVGDTLRLLRNQ